jgi:hypothetical protein
VAKSGCDHGTTAKECRRSLAGAGLLKKLLVISNPRDLFLYTGFFLYFFLLLNSGLSNWLVILKLLAIVFTQLLVGMLIFSLSSVSKALTFLNFTVVSFVIGTSVNTMNHSFFKDYPIKVLAYAVLSVLILFGIPRLISRLKSESFSVKVSKTSLSLILLILGIIELQILNWAKVNPISWQGWWKFHIDIAYLESLSNSLEVFGPYGSTMDVNGEIKYHWFAYSLIGQLNSLSGAEPFFVLTRFFPVILLFVSAISMYGFSSIFLKRIELRYLSIIILLLGPGLSIGSLIPLWSPSSALSVPYSLGFLIYFSKLLSLKKFSMVDFLLLSIFAIAVVGSKATSAVIISLGLMMTTMHLFLKNRRKSQSNNLLMLLTSFLLNFSFLGLIWTNDARTLGFQIFLGWPSLLATSLGLFVGLVFLIIRKEIKESDLLFLYVALTGAILSLITRDNDGNQLYFFFTALLVVIPISLTWLSEFYVGTLRELVRLKIWIPISAFISTLPVIVWLNFETRTGIVGDIGRSLAPFVMVFGAFAIFVFFQSRNEHITRFNKSYLMMSILLVVTILSSFFMTISEYVYGPKYSKIDGITKIGVAKEVEPGSISYDYVLAGKWVSLNIPKGAIGFTNRQCFDAKSSNDTCDTRWFFASALSKRSFLIEGSAYSSGGLRQAKKLSPNEELSVEFSRNPNPASHRELLNKGVTWGWIDKNSTELRSWVPYAKVLFENSQVMIIQLKK